MAGRTATSVTSVNRTALTALPQPSVAGDAGNGNVSPNDGATFFAIYNADAGGTYDFSVELAAGVDGLSAGATRVYTIPASGSGVQVVGPFPIQFYGSRLLWNVTSTNLKVALYSLLGP
jgi:hypothetical protein